MINMVNSGIGFDTVADEPVTKLKIEYDKKVLQRKALMKWLKKFKMVRSDLEITGNEMDNKLARAVIDTLINAVEKPEETLVES